MNVDLDDPWALQTAAFVSSSALAIQLWEYIHLFVDEVEYIWSGPLTLIKSLYFVSRYLPLILQIVNIGLQHIRAHHYDRVAFCIGVSTYQVFLSLEAILCFELVLVVRVYALFNRSRHIRRLLYGVVLVSWTLQVVSSMRALNSLVLRTTCIAGRLTTENIFMFSVGVGINLGTILILTMWKYVGAHHYGWGRSPLTSLMLRDGLFACCIVVGILSVAIFCESVRTVRMDPVEISYAWYIALLSITSSRLVLNMRKVSFSRPSHRVLSDQELEADGLILEESSEETDTYEY